MKIIKEKNLKESKSYKLMANTYDGVYETGDFSWEDIRGKMHRVIPDKPDFFFDELSTLSDGEVVASLVDQDTYDRIEATYGKINKK